MVIKKIKAGELESFIFSEEYKKLNDLPISRQRALSHVRNPRVKEEDVVLIMAYTENNKMVGYLGVLADQITIKEVEYRVGWFSCLWVDENTRGKGIAKKLLNEAFQAWNNQLLVTEFTREAKSLYDRSEQFMDLKRSDGIRGYLRFNFNELLPPKKDFFLKNKRILKGLDNFLNLFHDIRLSFWKSSFRLKDFRIEYISEIDQEVKELIEKRSSFTNRKGTDLNWILKNPWIIQAPVQDAFSKRYHFSALNKNFQFMAVKLLDEDNKILAFLILSVKGKNLKVPYCYFNPDDAKQVIRLIYAHMLEMNLNMLTLFDPVLIKNMKDIRNPFFYTKQINRHYIISKKFREEIKDMEIIFQDGDADCSFS